MTFAPSPAITPQLAGPDWIDVARREIGAREIPGASDNPRIVAFFRDAGHPEVEDDETAWCAAFLCAVLERSGIVSPRTVRARDFLTWGRALAEPVPGAIAVFWRDSPASTAGHVGIYLSHTAAKIEILGGNQSGAVTVERMPASHLLGFRWPEARPDAAFETALAHVLAVEGGWSDDPYDPGGKTNKGITISEYARWLGVSLAGPEAARVEARLRQISDAEAARIYRVNYWLPACCHCLPRAIALMQFDAAVNHGVRRAALFLQQAAGVMTDGEIGPLTLRAAHTLAPSTLLARYADLRRAHYRSLPHFWRFGRGWLARVDKTVRAASGTPSPEENEPMSTPDTIPTDGKWWGRSLTIWGVIVTALSTVLPIVAQVFGIELSPDLVRQLGASLTTLAQAVAGVVGIVMTIVGRFRARQPLVRQDVTVKL